MLLAASICTIGAVIMATSYSLGQILAGRLIIGVGVGFFTGTVPMYVSETADARRRGQLVLIEGFFALSGLAIASWVNYGMYYTHGAVSWSYDLLLLFGFVHSPDWDVHCAVHVWC